MNYAEIKNLDCANGLGLRVSLFVSGCRNHCKGCFNQCTWDFNYGQKFTDETIKHIITLLKNPYIKGLSILGGDPLEEENQKDVALLIDEVRLTFGEDKDIWLWTGYNYDKLKSGNEKHTEFTNKILESVDVIIDGRFIEEQKDLTLDWRGSGNQRIIKIE